MKALYISYDGLLEPLGQSQIIPYLKELSKRGIRFVLLTFDKKYFTDKTKESQLKKDLEDFNIKWISLPYHKKPAVLSTILDVTMGFTLSFMLIKIEKLDIVHARGYVPSLITLFLKRIFRLKFIFDMRGFWADEKAECGHWDKKSIIYRVAKSFEKEFIKHADEIVVLTEYANSVVRNHRRGSGNIITIPCCADTDIFKTDLNTRMALKRKNNLDGKFVFAHVGSLETWYMKGEMLDYFKAAKQVNSNVHFLILTHSPREEILRLISQKGIAIRDITIKAVSFEKIPEHLLLVDAGIIFISLGFSKRACFPTKFAEFLSCAIPVVSGKGIGDIEKIILEHKVGVIVNDFKEEEYKRTFLELLKLKEDKGLESRCRRLAESRFSLQVGIEKYGDIYSRLGNAIQHQIHYL
ncbi:MAG: glycosyltransferase family 4 protein [Candidatus Omnitrophica bacterium]|nr:glycosyltransferase family 4 protein [Candidatus Omnitrophota bacterium]